MDGCTEREGGNVRGIAAELNRPPHRPLAPCRAAPIKTCTTTATMTRFLAIERAPPNRDNAMTIEHPPSTEATMMLLYAHAFAAAV
jgi:hypothetical protein